MRLSLLSLAALLVACSSEDEAPAPGPTGWQIGVTVADISPNETELAGGEVYMGAYGTPISVSAARFRRSRFRARR